LDAAAQARGEQLSSSNASATRGIKDVKSSAAGAARSAAPAPLSTRRAAAVHA
jgi:hypothetical protein